MATTVTKGQHPVSWTAFAFAISRSPFYYTEALHLEHRSVFWRVLYTWLHLGKWSRPKWHHDNTMTCQHSPRTTAPLPRLLSVTSGNPVFRSFTPSRLRRSGIQETSGVNELEVIS